MKRADQRRIVLMTLGLFALFSLLIVQFYRIQILEGEKWESKARGQHFFIVKEPFRRGVFWSNPTLREGHPQEEQPFVVDVEAFHLFIDPVSIPIAHRDFVAGTLAEILVITDEEEGALRNQFDLKSRSRKLSMWLDRDTRDAILDWWFPYARKYKIARNALFFETDYQRSYPFGKLMGQVLHTIQSNKNELTRQALPTGGLELYFHTYLTGKQGKRRLKRSPRNAFETGEVIAEPQHGADVYLTIDPYIQAIAEEELAKGVKRCQAKGGWAVMMNPHDGEILALAQYPFFDPADYQRYFNDPQLIEHTRIKAITDANEPGSIIKPITLAIGLHANAVLREQGEEPLFDPEEKVASADGRFSGRRPLKDLGRVHHFLNMDMALQKSSNIYMARLIEKVVDKLGKEWYWNQLHDTFGFAKKTGVELPSESQGVLPTPGRRHANGKLEWSLPTPISLAMGYNMQSNSLQVVRAFAVLANGGFFVQPTLLRQIVKTHTKEGREVLVDNTSPDRMLTFPRVLDQEIVDRVVQSMKYVTKPGGSAKRADLWGYTEAGKTGTAEKLVNGAYAKKRNVATFVGFAPLSHPQFVLLVSIDEPECRYIPGVGKNQHGGYAAAPVFRGIAKRTLAYLGIPPDDPYGYHNFDPRFDREQADWLAELARLKELYDTWNTR